MQIGYRMAPRLEIVTLRDWRFKARVPCRIRALAGGALVAGIGAPIVRFRMVSASLDLG